MNTPSACLLDEAERKSGVRERSRVGKSDAHGSGPARSPADPAAWTSEQTRVDRQEFLASEPPPSDSVPRRRFFYGWVILPLAMLAMVASSPGQTFGVSIFNEPMRLSLGFSHSQMAAAYTLGTLLGAIPIMYIGVLMDRHGLRRTTLGVVTVLTLACLWISLAQNWLMLAIAFFFLRMLGPGALSLLSSSALPFWFDRRLGLVEGFRSLGHAGAMALIPGVNLWLVTHFGWRGGYALLGLGIWIVLIPLYLLFFRNRPEDVGQSIDNGGHREGASVASGIAAEATAADSLDPIAVPGTVGSGTSSTRRPQPDFTLKQSLRTFPFWIAALGSSMFGLVHTALFFCMIPIYEERGLNERDAAVTLMTFAVTLAVLQLIGGYLADRIRAQPLMACGLLGLSIGVAIQYSAASPGGAIAAGLVFGISLGIYSGANQPLWARYFGRLHLGKIRGMLTTMNISCSSIGPLIAGTVRDLHGNFDPAMFIFMALPIPLALLSLLAARPVAPVLGGIQK